MGIAETTMKSTILVAEVYPFALPGSTLVWPKCPFIKKFLGIWTLESTCCIIQTHKDHGKPKASRFS
jgi:hypothetical protein